MEGATLAIKRLEDANIGPLKLNYTGYVCHALGDLASCLACIDKALEYRPMAATGGFVTGRPLPAESRADPRYPKLLDEFRRRKGLSKQAVRDCSGARRQSRSPIWRG